MLDSEGGESFSKEIGAPLLHDPCDFSIAVEEAPVDVTRDLLYGTCILSLWELPYLLFVPSVLKLFTGVFCVALLSSIVLGTWRNSGSRNRCPLCPGNFLGLFLR